MREQMKSGGGGCTAVGAMQGDACAGGSRGCDPTHHRVADGPTAIAAPASRRPVPSRTRLAPQVRTRSHRLRPRSLVPPSVATSRGCASSTCHIIQGKARQGVAMPCSGQTGEALTILPVVPGCDLALPVSGSATHTDTHTHTATHIDTHT
jgi:hypothetical protein